MGKKTKNCLTEYVKSQDITGVPVTLNFKKKATH